MLKRLDLVGFKSFADLTTFEFAAGITAVVGPNGSGKSNIVDAVRWILGEQSAKSLRGGEMTDVIFNGSTSRKSLGMAEVSLTFDNSPRSTNDDGPARRPLPMDAAEVRITRRVYRDGEGEYLINNQDCRLKDIKDLLLGTGAGSAANCIIEQGRVAALLEASSKDRRALFEEAAGISRFKARKTETLRKLEKVEHNLARVRDVVGEVEGQLRTVRLQAAKAQRHQEYTARLRELRLALGLREYHDLTGRLHTEQAELERLRIELASWTEQAEGWEADARQREKRLSGLDEAIRAEEERLSLAREQIAALEAAAAHEQATAVDLATDLKRTQTRRGELAERAAELERTADRAAADRDEAAEQRRLQHQQAVSLEADLAAVEQEAVELRGRLQHDRDEHLESARREADLRNDVLATKSDLDRLTRERDRLRSRSEQTLGELANLDQELEGLINSEAELQGQLTAARHAHADRNRERTELRQRGDDTQHRLADLRVQRGRLAERVEVLERLERGHEGLGTGVREVVALLQQAAEDRERPILAGETDPLANHVVGLVADLLTVPRDAAPLIDLALGDAAQRFVVRDPAGLDTLLNTRRAFAGRVTFVPLANDERPLLPPEAEPFRADRLVGVTDPSLAALPAQLLGRTLLVADLAEARRLAAMCGPTVRFVTRTGELLEADGTLTVGTHHAETGIVSRKSELRELRDELALLDAVAGEVEAELARLRQQADALEKPLLALDHEIGVLTNQLVDLGSRITRHRDRRADLSEDVAVSETEISGIETDLAAVTEANREAVQRAEQARTAALDLQDRIDRAERAARLCEERRATLQQEFTRAQVLLAQTDERLAGLEARAVQTAADLRQRARELEQADRHERELLERIAASERAAVAAAAELAQCQQKRQAAEQRAAELSAERDRERDERRQLLEQAQEVRLRWQARWEQAHAHDKAAGELAQKRASLTERLRDDYAVDLAAMYAQATSDPEQPASFTVADDVHDEIEDLRKKVARLGSVNLDALQELAELEKRAGDLQAQVDDLSAAEKSLRQIIDEINSDSRRLFTETYTTVRAHFQELFRKLFGGGMADVVLEDEGDVLESGIEVTARPPGKEPRSISLMSGGEKTLTAVALLLAIFRSKPSPFCLLDEVDAALDEANTVRLGATLREFTDRSQFIMITHKKRTMAAADVLYGVTMQESGVSKQVAVRFEDYPEDEEQKQAA